MRAGTYRDQKNQSPYPLIGKCIYCGSTEQKDLSDEHCVPEALNGRFKLLKASCGQCRDMTSAFEGNITHHALGELRAAMQYKVKAKRKKNRPISYPVQVKIEGEVRTVDMPVEAIVGVKPSLDVGLPTYLAGKYFPNMAIVPTGLKGVEGKLVYRSPEKTKAFLDGIGADSIEAHLKMSVNEFARLLAKIGYCEAIATLHTHGLGGFEDIEEVYVLPLIRGDVSDPWRFVGSQTPILDVEPHTTNPDAIAITLLNGDILAHIQLFIGAGPDREYLVAVGRASEALRERFRKLGDTDV